MDLFVVPTIRFDLLYAFVIVRLDRRDLIWINVTTNPTAEWIARQLTEAFPWDEAPRYLIRDRDGIYGSVVTRRLRAMGIRDKKTCARSAVRHLVVHLKLQWLLGLLPTLRGRGLATKARHRYPFHVEAKSELLQARRHSTGR